MGKDKNGIGNRGLKELICAAHGHELRWGECWKVEGAGQRGDKGRKNWGNCNSIFNKNT